MITGCAFDRPPHFDTSCANLIIHDSAQGVSFWSRATDSELHGWIIYDNGWDAPDRGHGHAIYTQNEKGVKTISDCIMTGGYGYSMHAYGSSRAFVDHYLATTRVNVRPNRYDASRFHVVVLNWTRSPTVGLELGRQLKTGESYRLMDPRDLFGEPVAAGVYDRHPIPVSMRGEFAALVLLKGPRGSRPLR